MSWWSRTRQQPLAVEYGTEDCGRVAREFRVASATVRSQVTGDHEDYASAMKDDST